MEELVIFEKSTTDPPRGGNILAAEKVQIISFQILKPLK